MKFKNLERRGRRRPVEAWSDVSNFCWYGPKFLDFSVLDKSVLVRGFLTNTSCLDLTKALVRFGLKSEFGGRSVADECLSQYNLNEPLAQRDLHYSTCPILVWPEIL